MQLSFIYTPTVVTKRMYIATYVDCGREAGMECWRLLKKWCLKLLLLALPFYVNFIETAYINTHT